MSKMPEIYILKKKIQLPSMISFVICNRQEVSDTYCIMLEIDAAFKKKGELKAFS